MAYRRTFQMLGLDVEGKLTQDQFPVEEELLEHRKVDRHDLHRRIF